MSNEIVKIIVEMVVIWSYMILWPFIDTSIFAAILMPISLAYTAYRLAFFVYGVLFKRL